MDTCAAPSFFAERSKLFRQLDAHLSMGLLNKHLNMGSYDSLRRDLGISSRSLVHHWSKAGAPGAIPGYSTHLDKLARLSNHLKKGGYVGLGLGAGSGLMNIHQACQEGRTEACKKVTFKESGSFAGGLAFGTLAGKASGAVAAAACLSFGPFSAAVCTIIIVGAGTAAGSMAGMAGGEWFAKPFMNIQSRSIHYGISSTNHENTYGDSIMFHDDDRTGTLYPLGAN